MFNIKSLARMAICTALIVVCSWLTVPFTVPFTMQTFAIFFTVCLLGPWQGMISILVYILLGAVGVPVFSGFRGGLDALLGPTGGYILGFLATAAERFLISRRLVAYFAAGVCALLITALAQGLRVLVLYDGEVTAILRVALLQTLYSIPFIFALYFPCRALAQRVLD